MTPEGCLSSQYLVEEHVHIENLKEMERVLTAKLDQ
jgi:hypothetical protein